MSDIFIREFKSQIPIADVIGEVVRLKKSGTSLMGICPFHQERSPSFSVVPNKGIFHCFGCHKSGDVITFVQEFQAVSFMDAVKILASNFGITLPDSFKRNTGTSVTPESQNSVLYRLNNYVATFYHERLTALDGPVAREYLKKRGISEESIRNFKIGFAPDDWSGLVDFLAKTKAPLEKAEVLGLIRKKEDSPKKNEQRKDDSRYYDFFRNKVMFPVIDIKGRVLAFGGRALNPDEKPKYLNSPESPLFHKSNTLFGIFHAQKNIRADDLCVIVEGFMDCISLHQAGFGCTVATLGTALTTEQVKILKRLTGNIVIVFDGDEAGQRAQAKAMETFLNEDVVVRGISMQDELDPDEFIQEKGPGAFLELLKNAPYLLDQKILELASESKRHVEGKMRAIDKILPWIAKLQSKTARFARLHHISSLFNIDFAALEKQAGGIIMPAQQTYGAVIQPKPLKTNGKFDIWDVKFIENIIVHPQIALNEAEIKNGIAGMLSEQIQETGLQIIEKLQRDFLAGITPENSLGQEILEYTKNTEIQHILMKALVTAEEEKCKQKEKDADFKIEMKDLVAKLIRRSLGKKRDQLRANILRAESSGNEEEQADLTQQLNLLVRQLEK